MALVSKRTIPCLLADEGAVNWYRTREQNFQEELQ